jgi:alpha-glucosidase
MIKYFSFIIYSFYFLFVCAVIPVPVYSQPPSSIQINSPNRNLVMEVKLTKNGNLLYTVSYKDTRVIEESALGIATFQNGLSWEETSRRSYDTTWVPVYGERSRVRDYYNEVKIVVSRGKRQNINLVIRAYDQGIAFQYVFPEYEDGSSYVRIEKEFTQFTLPVSTQAFFTPQPQGLYQLLPLKDWPNESERPLTLQLPNGIFACLTEAEMVNYSRTKFALSLEKPNTILTAMYDPVEEIPPFASPWRVIMVAERPGQLLENNDLILNLNKPNVIQNTSWIKPGKAMREFTFFTAEAKKVVDFAVKQNLQYIHFDAGWYGLEYVSKSDARQVNLDRGRSPNGDLDLPEVIRYATKNGIKVILYVNQRALSKQLDEIFPLYKSWGVAGVKFGFVHVGSHRWTTWLHEAVKKAAQYELIVDIHDNYRPTGFSRTYPNLLTQEGIRGNEEMPDATQNTILPFTRFIAGAADYTFCFNEPRVKNTNAHQLALPSIFYSPLQFLYWYGRPNHYPDLSQLEFWKYIPTVWDDTKVLTGVPGEFVTVARRSGSEWYIGAITNTQPRNQQVTLDFLEKGRKYIAWIYEDGPQGKITKRTLTVKNGQIISLKLNASGGAALRIF